MKAPSRGARTQIAALTLLLVSIVAVLPAAGAKPGPRARQFVLTRTSEGPTTLLIHAAADAPVNGRELIAVAPVRVDKGRLRSTHSGFLFASEGGGYPEAYVLGDRVDCASAGNPQDLCNKTITGGGRSTTMEFTFDGGADDPTHTIAVVEGLRIDFDIRGSRGWSMTEVAPSFSVASSKDSQSIGAHHRLGGGAELFLSTSTRTRNGASIAIAQPPCGYPTGTGFVNVGLGFSRLTGGKQQPESVCPGIYQVNEAGYYAMSDFSARRTTWKLAGAVAGGTSSMASVRMIVINVGADTLAAFRR